MSQFSLPALRVFQNGTEMFLVAIPARRLAELDIRVERFDASLFDQFRKGQISAEHLLQKQGYQRAVEKNRVNRFATYLKQDSAISPTVLLINDREGGCKFDEETGELLFDTDVTLFIFDGQHRKDGYVKALLDEAKLGEFPVFVVITSDIDKRREMEQFQVINGTAKGVKTNLVVEIKAALNQDVIGTNAKDAKKIVCNHAMHAVNSREDSPWKGMIIAANQSKIRKSEIRDNPELDLQRILGSTSFIESLGPVYDYLLTHRMWGGGANVELQARGERIADIVIEFWKAVHELMPEPFYAPKDYLLHKGIGCMSLHRVLQHLLGVMHQARRDWTADQFQIMLEPSPWLTQSDYWEAKDSEASNYAAATRAGAEKLAGEIIDSLQSTPMAK
jgi:DGQHR domain-containing protein